MKLVFDGHKMSRLPHTPTRILKVHIEALMGSVMYLVQMVSTTPTLSRLHPCNNHWLGNISQDVQSKDRGEVRVFQLPRSSSRFK